MGWGVDFKRPGLLRSLLVQGPKGGRDRGSQSPPVREVLLIARSLPDPSLYKTGRITVPFCEKCHLRMPRCGCCSCLLTHCLWRVSRHGTARTAMLCFLGQGKVSRLALRLRPCQVQSSGRNHTSSRQAQQSWGRGGAGGFPICSTGGKHPPILEMGLCKGEPLINVSGSLHRSWEELERSFLLQSRKMHHTLWLRVTCPYSRRLRDTIVSSGCYRVHCVSTCKHSLLFMNQHSCLSLWGRGA